MRSWTIWASISLQLVSPQRSEAQIVLTMGGYSLHEIFHLTEYSLSILLGILSLTGMSHLNTERIHVSNKLSGSADSMIESFRTNQFNRFYQRLCGIT